jgi:parvulin-like peptidyl-prolyl isomerase
MKSKFKLWVIGAAIITTTLTGCASRNSTGDGDRKKVIAVVNGENILKGEFLDSYNVEKQNYGITAENENSTENAEMVKNLKTGILDNLVYQKLITQNAKKEGFTVNDEIKAEAKKEFDGIVASIEEQMKSQGGTANEDYAKKAKDYVDEQLKTIGKTQDEYVQMIAEQMVTEKFKSKVTADVQVTDKDIQDYYDSEVKNQQSQGSAYAAVELVKQPEVRVKHILIQLPKEQQDEFNKLFNEKKTEEAQKYLDAKLKEIQPKAQQVLDKAKSGENFEKLIEEFGEDPGMQGNEQGYIVKQDGQFVPEFEEASFKLKVGEISGLVSSNYGYHIIKAYEKNPEKVFTLAEKKDEIKQALISQKQDEK